MSETRSEAEKMFVAGDRRRGGVVLAVGMIAMLTLIQVAPVLGGKRIAGAVLAYVAGAVVVVGLLIAIHRRDLIASVLLPSAVVELSLLLTTYADHRATLLGLLRDLAMAGQRDPLEVYLSWFVPALVLAVLVASGPRESKGWWVFVAAVLLVLCVPLEWPPDGLFI